MTFPDAEAIAAAYRLTRLITADALTLGLRRQVIADAYGYSDGLSDAQQQLAAGIGLDPTVANVASQPWEKLVPRDVDPPKVAYLVQCPWCAGLYVAVVVVALERWAPRGWRTVRRVLALSTVIGLAAGHETP